jgi:hypothetical protein
MERPAPTVRPLARRWHNRLLRACGERLVDWGFPGTGLNEEALCRAARRRARLEDFGGDEFVVPLRRVLRDFETERGLVGRLALRGSIVEGLVNRLRIQEALKRHPEIRSVAVRRPLFVVGLPRTGTTLLHALLAQDPGGRALAAWELQQPWPLDGLRAGRVDPRIKEMRWRQGFINFVVPEARVVHDVEAEQPDECRLLFRNALADAWGLFGDVPEFQRWQLEHDMRAEYRYYRLQLQMLLWQRPAGYLVLKYPGHLWHLDALLETFPDACVVVTHRDPLEVVGSCCSLVALVRRALSKETDRARLGPSVLDGLVEGVARMMAVRERHDPRRFVDVTYDELTRDPLDVVQGIHDHFGLRGGEPMRRAMERWLAEHRQDRHGRHVYHLADYGLTEADVSQRFRAYSRRHLRKTLAGTMPALGTAGSARTRKQHPS